jgi:HSP20 family protein
LATPGFTKNDLKIELENNMVTVYGEKKLTNKKEKGEYISKEYHSTKFYRSFTLPENVVVDEIHAKVENGITTLFLPKVTPTKSKNLSKTIEIE